MGADDLTDCISCTPGYYCEGLANTKPTGECADGYYCPGGAYNAVQNETKPGYYTTLGSSNPSPCSPGTYNDAYRQTSCKICPQGYYCPNSGMASFIGFPCTAGHYCPIGTIQPVKCPPGTFSNQIGNVNVSQCTLCTTGDYCDADALQAVSGPCDAGYFCIIGAKSQTQPVLSSTGGPCTPGHYCLSGSASPLPCPRGTYMSNYLNNGQKFFQGANYYCDLCPSGKACSSLALTNYSSIVSAGYWAAAGAPSATPICQFANCTTMYGACPIGYYCPAGSTAPIPCSAGTYQNLTGQSTCQV